MTTTPPLTWDGLTPEMQARLVAISRGEQPTRDNVYLELVKLNLIGLVTHSSFGYSSDLQFVTRKGGELLRQRDAILVAALTAYANGEYLGKGKAQAALAQVQEGGEHE